MSAHKTERTIDKTEQQLATLRAAVDAVRQGVLVVDATSDRIIDANPVACRTLGLDRDALIGRSWTVTAHRLPEAKIHKVDGDRERFVVVSRELVPEGGDKPEMPRDALTGLASREALLARTCWDNQRQPSARTALLFIDLDDFKQVNDGWGHVVGDRVLQIVAERLSHCIRPSDLLVRFGGDEFVVLIDGVRRRRDLERLARRITRGMRVPIMVGGHQFVISASVGIAKRSADLMSIEALIAEADRAMYRAKNRHRQSAAAIGPAAWRFSDERLRESTPDPIIRRRLLARATLSKSVSAASRPHPAQCLAEAGEFDAPELLPPRRRPK